MTAYADSAYAITLYGTSYVTVACDRNLDGSLDTTSFDAHLELATKTVNSYLFGRYSVPLDTPPDTIKKAVVDLAIYTACGTPDVMTNLIRDRYTDAIKYLKDISANRVKLEVSADESTANQARHPETTVRTLQTYTDCTRTFKSDRLGRLL